MTTVDIGSQEAEHAAGAAEALRLDLERCQRERDERWNRMEQMRQAETLLAGENRLLEMVARGCSLSEIQTALCRLIEDLANGKRAWPPLVFGGSYGPSSFSTLF